MTTTREAAPIEIDRAMLQSMAASFRGALEFSFNRHDMAELMDRCAALSTPATEPHGLVWNDGDEESTAEGPLGNYAIWKSVEGWEASFKGVLAPQMYASREAAKAAAQLNYAATEPQGYVDGLTQRQKEIIARLTEMKATGWSALAFHDESVELKREFYGNVSGWVYLPSPLDAFAARPAPQPAADTRVVVKPLAWAETYEGELWTAGSYDVWYENGGFQLYHWSIICGDARTSLAGAQDAAFAHHQASILSAITPAPSDKIAEAARALLFHFAGSDQSDDRNWFATMIELDGVLPALRALAGKGE